MLLLARCSIWAALALHAVNAAITGQRRCEFALCVTGTYDSGTGLDTYTLSPPPERALPQGQFGWAAIGFGTAMRDSPMIMVWPNADGGFTLTQRSPAYHKPPPVDETPARRATLLPHRSFSNATSTSISFTVTHSPTSSGPVMLIWAYASTPPSDPGPSARFRMHDLFGRMSLDLAAPLDNALNPMPVEEEGEGPFGGKGKRKIVLAHAICGGLATLLFIPAAVLVPRFARGLTRKRWWFPMHAAVNGVLAMGLVLVGFILAVTSFHRGFSSPHRGLGLAMFVLMLLQVALGVAVHWVKVRPHALMTESGRGPSNFIHMGLGVAIVCVGWATSFTGMQQEWPKWSGQGYLPRVWLFVWAILAGSAAVAYLFGLVYYLPDQLRMEREGRRDARTSGRAQALGEQLERERRDKLFQDRFEMARM